ncbi:MAG: sulfate adenylyltransferase subunit CysD [Bdellovibrio sp.]|nr:MAG: sulfate adenylyltransferase subunit CysD [Bdellovibrio sp.]
MSDREIRHLSELESESIYILRDTVAQFRNPVMLYSVGKDSTCLLHLARKAFFPAPIPFPLLHIDTGYKFKEMYEFRDRMAKKFGVELHVYGNTEAQRNNTNPYDLGTQRCCALLKTQGLLGALEHFGFDAAIGGARRDEERSRAKERIFSIRDKFGQWKPSHQRPEPWGLLNGLLPPAETMRVFPLSNWTELDVWNYIQMERIEVVPLYFSRSRPMVQVGQMWIPAEGGPPGLSPDRIVMREVRYRSLGCTPCTAAIESRASTVAEIIAELKVATNSERGQRVIDFDSEASMESRKREGYF